MQKLKSISVILLLSAGFLTVPDTGFAKNPMRVTTEENNILVLTGERILLRYRYLDVPYKPYVDQLFTPNGINVLVDAPVDHLHHHALMFAVMANGVNFWEEHQAPGRQVHRRFNSTIINTRENVPFAGFSENIEWMNPQNGELLLTECRTIEVRQLAEPKVTLLTWVSKLEPAAGKKEVTLTGSHYHGLGMRFIRSMDTAGEFRNADGKDGEIFRGQERLVQSRWCAYTAKANGKDVTAAMFDHPGNERHPATWFTMAKPFAYLSVTLGLHEQPFKISSDDALVLRYGVALWDGRADTEQIEKTYKYWVVGVIKQQPAK